MNRVSLYWLRNRLIQMSRLISVLLICCVFVSSCSPAIQQTRVLQKSAPAPVLGVVVDGKFNVLHVEPGGVAAAAGVKAQDILISLDGIAFDVKPEARNRIKNLIATSNSDHTSKHLKLLLRRAGQEMNIDIVPLPPNSKPSAEDGKLMLTVTPVAQGNDYF